MMIGLLLHFMRPAAFSFAIFICLYLLSRHTCAGIFCFYLESGEVLRKDGSVLVSPGWEVANKKKRYQGKSLIPFGAEGETRTLAPVSRPTPLAGAPRHQLEYFCILCCNLC